MRDGHVIAQVRYRDETIECVCGEVVTAPADVASHDRHGPLDAAWSAHRRANGCKVLTVNQVLGYRRADADSPWSSWRAKGASLRPRAGR